MGIRGKEIYRKSQDDIGDDAGQWIAFGDLMSGLLAFIVMVSGTALMMFILPGAGITENLKNDTGRKYDIRKFFEDAQNGLFDPNEDGSVTLHYARMFQDNGEVPIDFDYGQTNIPINKLEELIEGCDLILGEIESFQSKHLKIDFSLQVIGMSSCRNDQWRDRRDITSYENYRHTIENLDLSYRRALEVFNICFNWRSFDPSVIRSRNQLLRWIDESSNGNSRLNLRRPQGERDELLTTLLDNSLEPTHMGVLDRIEVVAGAEARAAADNDGVCSDRSPSPQHDRYHQGVMLRVVEYDLSRTRR